MNTPLVLLVLTPALLACGCTRTGTAAPAVPPVQATAPATPNLTGTWTGPLQGFDERTGFTDYPGLSLAMTVSGQLGRLVAGNFTFTANGTATRSASAGAVGRDGKTLTIAEKDGGYGTGTLPGPGEMELTCMQDGSPYSIAIDSFRRV